MISKDKKKISIIIAIITLLIFSVSTIFMINRQENIELVNPEVLRSKAYTQITENDAKVNNCDYVQFSAFFTRDLNGDGNAEKLLGSCQEISSSDELYLDINVLTNGKLKDGKITIENTNFMYSMNMVRDSVLKKNYISSDVKEIELNDISAGTQKLIIGNIKPFLNNNINNYSNTNKIKLTGTHVADDGVTETPIEKEFIITVDWHGKTTTKLYQSTEEYYYDELSSNTLKLEVKTEELDKKLLLKENFVTLEIPNLQGFAPTDVVCTNSNVISEYNKDTQILTIKRTSEVDENGNVVTVLSTLNTYDVEITYPDEAYSNVTSYTKLEINTTTYYDGYNNTSEEFDNPYRSNIAKAALNIIFKEKPQGEIYNFYVNFEDKKQAVTPTRRYVISKQTLLNAFNEDDSDNIQYTVSWRAARGPAGIVDSMIMQETKAADYGDQWDQLYIDDYVSNVGIYFEGVDTILTDDGYINIFDNDTNELVKTISKSELSKYTKSNPLNYETPIKHIRIETSQANNNSDLKVYNIKEIDVEKVKNDFTPEKIENVNMMYTYLEGICNIQGGNSETLLRSDAVYYESEKSNVDLSLSKNGLSTQETCNDQIIRISTKNTQEIDSNWQNGIFLLEFPEEIIKLNIKNITLSNSNVSLVAYDLYKENNKYFLKIFTENEKPDIYDIIINCSLTPDPRIASVSKDLKLYSYNEICDRYFYELADNYDIDSDENITELKGYNTENLSLLSPTSLITLETITDYNEAKDVTVGPNVAELDIDQNQATVNVVLTNNYPNPISGIKVLGKIPFKGNTHILNPNNLNSDFSVTMTNDGIRIPEALQDKIEIYYSELETPTNDVKDAANNWTKKEDVKDFSKIKSFLIDLKENQILIGEKYSFSYDVVLPQERAYNLVTYSTHAAYYELNTDGGNLQLATEPNKVGISFVRKFDFNLTKYKKGTNLLVPNATYNLVELNSNDEEVSSRVARTNNNGTLEIRDVYVGRTYLLKELYSPENYQLNDDEIKFKLVEKEDLSLEIQILSEDNFNTVPVISVNADNKDLLNVQVSDEPKYELTITKVSGSNKLKDIVFRIKETGKLYYTDQNGQMVISGLEQNKEYTLSELDAEGYYLLADIKFKLVKQADGSLKFESSNSAFQNAAIVNPTDEDLIKANVTLENEKIPTYSLKIIKIEETEEENLDNAKKLQGAKFELTGKDYNIQKTLTTNENGEINLSDLLVYVDGRELTGEYTLQEVESPLGYTNYAEEIKFRVIKNAESNLEIQIEDLANLQTVKNTAVEGNTIKLYIENKPAFKLVKKDSDTAEKIANVEFTIYELDKDGNQVDFAKNINNEYLGEKTDDNRYIIKTDENGEIALPLKDGKYRAIEVKPGEGYIASDSIYDFVVGGEQEEPEDFSSYIDIEIIDDTELALEIDSIEDLVQFSIDVKGGTTYDGKLVQLTRILDFNDDNSYDDSETMVFGDMNKNGTVETLKQELTSRDGSGYFSIGIGSSGSFKGTFDGKGYEIRNIYTNSNKATGYGNTNYGGVFGYIIDATIKNLGVTGEITTKSCAGGIVGYVQGNCKIDNCYNKATITTTSAYTGGVVGDMYSSNGSIVSNCYNTGTINTTGTYSGGVAADPRSNDIVINCYNTGTVYGQGSYIGGVCGYSTNKIINCYNTGDVYTPNGYSVGGVVGYGDIIVNSYNTGKIYGTTGIGGVAGTGTEITKCYNTGAVFCQGGTSGGVAASATTVTQCYNTGNVIGANQTTGIASANLIENCYNEGDITGTTAVSGISGNATIKNCYNEGKVSGQSWGNISCYQNSVSNTYYLETEEGALAGVPITEEYSKSKEFYEKLNSDNVWVYYGTTHPKLGIGSSALVVDGTTINIENTKKTFVVTTDVKEINGFKGGSISGEDEIRYEEIKYGEDNISEIIMKPDENFAISEITINDEKVVYTVNADGTYTIPAGYFTDVDEDKHIVVTYSLIAETLTINKVDVKDNTIKLKDAEFKVEQIEDYRDKVTVGEIIPNTKESYAPDKTNGNINEVLGELTPNNATYYFEEIDGKYVSNNKTRSTTAVSYIPIDLTNKTGKYIVELNAEVSAYAYNSANAHVTETTSSTSSSTGRFIDMGGIVPADNYLSAVLTGGKMYYLHFRYYNYTAGTGNDEFTINSVNVYPAKTVTYGFIKTDGKYVSNNQGINNTEAISYLPIDLTKNFGEYNIKVNAQVSSVSGDYGGVYILEEIGGTETQICYMYGEKTATDYTRTVNGGKMYYLKLKYYKDAKTSGGTDTFTVNSIDISPVLSVQEGKTDENGQLKLRAPYGKYKITELVAPEGYIIDEEPITFEVLPNEENIITITNSTTSNKFKITTDVNVQNGKKGGTITGEDEQPFEIVKASESNTKEISIEPEDGFVISRITINGENIPFTTNQDGTCTMPAGYFTDMQEDKHIVVTFSEENQTFTLNKVDENDNTKKLENAKFKIEQIDERILPTDAIGTMVISGNAFLDTQKPVSGVVGNLVANDSSYYFTEDDGKFVSNNTANYTTSKSYVPIDLTGLTGKYRVLVNAEISTDSSSYGYAVVTTSTSSPYYSNTNKFLDIRNETPAQDYESMVLEGGNKYYLHFAYYKAYSSSGANVGANKFTINNISVYGTTVYDYMAEVDGKYQSTNQNRNNTVASSYIPIDLTGVTGKYNLNVNAEISSELYGDYGYAYISNSTTTPNRSAIIGGMVYIAGEQEAKDYTTVLEGGKKYYLHIGYCKDDVNSIGTDTFTINSINLSLNGQDLYNETLTTNELGEIQTSIPAGKYKITEIESPEGYLLNSEPISYEMVIGEENNLTVTNIKEAIVRVHYYVAGTGEEFGTEPQKLAEETIINGLVNKDYTTAPKMDIQDYTLQTDENGEYIIPNNASGKFTEETIDVYYYYTKKTVNLVVHHYLEGTETKLAEDENYSYEKDETYKVTASEDVLKMYDLVEVVGEEEKVITQDEEVTYYYKKKTYDISTKVNVPEGNEKGGTIYGEEKEIYETVEHGEKSTVEIIANPDDGYRVKEIKLVSTDENGNKTETIIYGENPNSEVTYTIDLDGNVKITDFENITQDKEVIVEFEKDDGRVIVHHYVENSTEKIYPDQVTIDSIGTKVTSSQVEVENYVVVQLPNNPEVTITKDTQEITYYYQRQYKVTTDTVKYQEPDATGEMVDVVGGTISGKGEASYEDILKGRNSQKEIIMTPNEGFEIVKVTIDGVEYDFKDLLQPDGSVTLGKEFFKNVDKDIHVEVDFRRKTKVTVKYLEVDTEKVLEKEEVIDGYVGKEFETSRKNITNYKAAELNITDENKAAIEANGNMTVDEITIIYWYEKIPSGIIVKHVEKETIKTINPETGLEEITIKEVLLEEEEIPGLAGEEKTTNRKTYEQYISSENSNATQGINVGKTENSKTVTFSPDEVLEIVYWYEKQYEITTNVIEHTETDSEGNTISVKGGTISGDDEELYEGVIKSFDSTKEIKITPDDGYRIKQVKINGEEIYTEDKIAEDGTLTLEQFENMQENKNIEVEFEKIPAKVIVKYIDKDTNEAIIDDKVVDGFVNDEYNELRPEMESYIPAEPEPTNSIGKMTEDTITITYYYTKQFKVTTEVKEHEENDSTGNIVNVKGGQITGEELNPLEIVNRGENSIEEIIAKPDSGYRISKLTINGIDYDFEELLDDNKILKLSVFENMQEDKHIIVEFEKIPAKVIVKYIDEKTGKELVVEDEIDGFVNDEYRTQGKEIENYELNKDKLPSNSNGKMTEDEITVVYYYKFVEIKEEPQPEEPQPEEPQPEESQPEEPQPEEPQPEEPQPEEPQPEEPQPEEPQPEQSQPQDTLSTIPDQNIDKEENKLPSNSVNNSTHLQNAKTGDNILGYVILFMVSVVGIVVIIIGKNKKK